MAKFNPFSKFNSLIVVTGMPGAGKTTLAYKLSERFDIACLSLDTYKEVASSKYGFNGKFERDLIFELAKSLFKADVLVNVSLGLSLIVESAFMEEWQEFFDHIVDYYNYDIIVVDCNSKSFEEVWDNRVKRDTSDERSKCLTSIEFADDTCIRKDPYLLSDEHKQNSSRLYHASYFNRINGDYHIRDNEVYEEFLNVDIT